jgi:chromate reductase, NAD(P)H dehydrogenase (quinone)
MTTILGIAGSIRRESFNRKLLAAAALELPAEMELHTWDDLAQVPPFDEDLENHPAPQAVADLRRAITEADGVLIATPEYNASIPGQLKNALDWASRPYGDAALAGKPVAVIGASPSGYGAAWAQQELRKVLGSIGADVADGYLPVPHVFKQFDEDGTLLDHQLRENLTTLVAELGTRIRVSRTAA